MKLLKVALLTLGGASLVAGAPFAVKYLYPSRVGGPTVSGSHTSVLPRPGRASETVAAKFANVGAAHPVGDLPVPSAVALAVIATPEPRQKPAGTTAALPPKPTYEYREDVAQAQRHLATLGFGTGNADGKLGPKTRTAISSFQQKHGLTDTGDVDAQTLDKLGALAAEAARPVTPAAVPAPEPVKLVASAPAPQPTTTAPAPDADADPQFVVLKKPAIKASAAPADPGPVPTLTTTADVSRLQERLAASGSYSGNVDGKWGELSRNALKDFQEKAGLPVTGKPDKKTWIALNEQPAAKWDDIGRDTSAVDMALASRPRTGDVRIENALDSRMQAADGTSDAPAGLAAAAKLAAEAAAASTRAAKMPEPAVNITPDQLQSGSSDIRKLVGSGAEPPAEAPAKAEPAAPAPAPVAAAPASIEIKPDSAPKTLEVSEPASEPAATVKPAEAPAVAPGAEVVIRMNADAGPGSAGPVATPAAVSTDLTGSLGGEEARQVAVRDQAVETPKPDPFATKTKAEASKPAAKDAAGDSQFATLPPLPGDGGDRKPVSKVESATDDPKVANTAKLRLLEEQLAETQTRVAMVRNDTRYEIDKYAPEGMKEIQSLISKAERQVGSDGKDAEVASDALKKADEEIESIKRESLKRKAERKVGEVRDAYDLLKKRYGTEVKRDPLADTMAKIDAGYTAMQTDFKAGNYDPIVERCDGFKLAIEMLANDAAKAYLDTSLKSSTVKKKLTKKDLGAIESLREQNKFTEAAELLRGKTAGKASTKGRS